MEVVHLNFSNHLDEETPFATEGREIAALLKKKATDEEIQPVIERIHALAIDNNLDPLVASTDVFVTSVLHVGSKSLSHVLAAIERTKDRLTDIGASSEAARSQIITSVMQYWSAHSGVAITIVEKLLNYSILSPSDVINWTLVGLAGKTRGEALAQGYIYELVFNTVMKVTGRVRQLVNKRIAAITLDGVPADDAETAAAVEQEVSAMRSLFKDMEDALVAFATGTKDEIMETTDGLDKTEREKLVKRWGERWLRVFRRRAAIEEAYLIEKEREREKKVATAAAAAAEKASANGGGPAVDGDGDVVV